MLLRILGEVLVGLLAAGLVLAVIVPAIPQLGYELAPWVAWAASAGCIAACVMAGERRHKRRKASALP